MCIVSGFPSCRLVLTLMGFFGLVNCYTLRVNLSVAIVAMVNSTYLRELDNGTDSKSDVCAVEGENKTEAVDDNVRIWFSLTLSVKLHLNGQTDRHLKSNLVHFSLKM